MRTTLALLAALFCAGCVSETAQVEQQWIYSDEVAWYLDDVTGQVLPAQDIPVQPHMERYRPAPRPAVPPSSYAYVPSTSVAPVAPRTTYVTSRTPAPPRPSTQFRAHTPVVVRVSEQSVGPVPPQHAQRTTYAYVAPTSSAPSSLPVRVTRAPVTTTGTTTSTRLVSPYAAPSLVVPQRADRGDTGLAARRTTYQASRSAK